jgi:alkylation response protein AidB-like acyl-CoA dehydrogenase
VSSVYRAPLGDRRIMRFLFTEEQQDIARSARDLLGARSSWEQVRAHGEARTYDDGLWREVSRLGWPGIAVSADHGGAGLGLVELIAIFEQLGYACAPLPHLGTIGAALLIEAVGSREHQALWLPSLASGESRGAVGLTEGGVSQLVPDGAGADVVVLIDAAESQALVLERPSWEPVETIDPTRSYARVGAAGGTSIRGDVMGALDRLLVAVSAELVGLAQRALEMSVEYAKVRRQFGVPIGSFQATQHRMAEMLLHIEGARSATYYAAWVSDTQPERLASAAAIAKTTSSDAARYATGSAIQVHGGIGFTWESNVHWLFKRAQVDAAYLGTGAHHRARLADRLRPSDDRG